MERVLQMIGSLGIGGSQAMVMNLYRSINREKIQFDFIIDHTEDMHHVAEIKQLGGKVYVMPSFRGGNFFEIIKSWNNFFKEHPEYKILHSHVRSYAIIYILIAKKYGVKTLIHSHSTSNGVGIKSFVKKILQYPLRYSADWLLACSEDSGKWLFGESVLNKDNFCVFPNAIDINKYRFDEVIRNQYRKTFNIERKYVVGHIGRLHESKNHMFILEFIKELLSVNKDIVLVLVGDGELRKVIEDKIIELEISESVLLLGARSDIPQLLNMFDLFVFPSLWEGLPVSVVEAQATGLPCLISDTITDEVVIGNLVRKLPIDKGTECWVNEICNLINSERNNMCNIESTKFNALRVVDELEKIYRKLSL